MRLHRFFVQVDLSAHEVLIQNPEILSQWRTVLRLGTGDSVILCDGRGTEAEAVIHSMDKKEAVLSVTSTDTPRREPQTQTTLYAALLRRENFELVAQKATELGISRIVPILTTRTVKTGFNRVRLEKIITEACEQSGRTTLPVLSEPLAFPDALADCTPEASALLDLTGEDIGSATLPKNIHACFIGPEGGFTEEEVSAARAHGLTIAKLGALTLRGETAGIVASFLLVRS